MAENTVLQKQEHRSYLSASSLSSSSLSEERAARRVQGRQEAYAEELEALIQAAFTVVGRQGSLDAPVREIMREAGLSNQAFYRHVESKDELLLLMLDSGRRSLVRYLDRQMAHCEDPVSRTAVWISGVLAQATTAESARRTRPFIAQVDRLAELFPEEQRRSEDLLIDQIAAAAEVPPAEATAVYDLAFGSLARHLRRGTTPTDSDVDAVVAIATRLLDRQEH